MWVIARITKHVHSIAARRRRYVVKSLCTDRPVELGNGNRPQLAAVRSTGMTSHPAAAWELKRGGDRVDTAEARKARKTTLRFRSHYSNG